jgi:hypothetical protein
MRGAAWSFLRYAADRLRSTDGDLWFNLVNAPNTGIANLQARLGLDAAGLQSWVRDWAISTYVDDFVTTTSAAYTQPSWNIRSIYAGFNSAQVAFPLRAPAALSAGSPTTVTLRGGGFTVRRFSVPAGTSATVSIATSSSNVKLAVVRVR